MPNANERTDEQRVVVALEHDDARSSILKWRTSESSDWEALSTSNIIAVDHATSSGSASILLAAANPEAVEGSKASPAFFQVIQTSNVPPELITQFGLNQSSSLRRQGGTSPKHGAIHVIVSTGSGTGFAGEVWKSLVAPLLDYFDLAVDRDYDVHYTTSENSVAEYTLQTILPQANQGHDQLVILLSGDGGIVDIVNTLLGANKTEESFRKPVVALLPLGTGNALANSSEITGDATLGLRALLRGLPQEVPLFCARFSPGARLVVDEGRGEEPLKGMADGLPIAHGAVVCSWGMHAGLVADTDTAEYRKFGVDRFKMAAKEALFPSDGGLPHAYRGTVSIMRPEQTKWVPVPRESHGYVLVTLVSQLEAGFMISPASRPLDGQLRLVHFGSLTGQEAMEVLGQAYQAGKHVDDARIGYENVAGVRIAMDEDDGRWRRVCVDGKIVRVEKGGWVEVRKRESGVVDLMVTGT